MTTLIVFVIIAATTGAVCFGVDKLFSAIFRSKPQHKSGLSVRVSKRYAGFGIALLAIGIASILSGLDGSGILLYGGIFVFLLGFAMVLFYSSFGIFYDDQSFIIMTFGKSSESYGYDAILTQQLYITSSHVIIELRLKDGRSVSLQSSMDGIYHFMDTAFAGWCHANGKYVEDCPFYDPSNHCWFPTEE